MRNFIRNILIIIILILIFIKRPLVILAVINSLKLWQESILPSVFPIIIMSDLILSSNIINIISKYIGPLFTRIFKVSKYASYVIIMSFLSGCPTNAKYIKDLLDNNVIDNNEGIKLLSMSLLYNPILILSITSYLNYQDSIYLIMANLLANLIVGLLNRNYKCNNMSNNFKIKEFNLIASISKSIDIVMLILGCIITFAVLNSILPINHPLLSGILEITNGINGINNINILYKYKLIFTGILMGFGGLSILTQIKSIFKDTSLDYTLYYKSRIVHILLMLGFCYLRINL